MLKSFSVNFFEVNDVEKFEDLIIWQEARELTQYVRNLTNKSPFKNYFRFCSQIKSASGSIMDNVAEGFERDGNKEFIQFLYFAKGSSGEVRSHAFRAFDENFITLQEWEFLLVKTESLKYKINSLIDKLKNSGSKGYKNPPK